MTAKPRIVGLGGTSRPNSSSELALRACLARLEALEAVVRRERHARTLDLLTTWQATDPAIAQVIEAWLHRGDDGPGPPDGWEMPAALVDEVRALGHDPNDADVVDAVWRCLQVTDTPESSALAAIWHRAEQEAA